MTDREPTTEPLTTVPIEAAHPSNRLDAPPAPRQRKHRGLRALVVIIVVLALLVVAFFVGDHFARQYATNYVRERVATALDLPSTAPVSVDLGTGSLILQAISGRIDTVNVAVKPLTIQGITGSATVAATGVPLDSDKALNGLTLKVTVPASSLTSKITTIPQLKALGATVKVVGQHIAVAGKVKLLVFTVPIGLNLTPGVSDGKPTFRITSIEVGGHRVAASTLDKYVPGFANLVKNNQSICIASALPKELKVTGVSLHGTSLSYTLTGTDVKLNDRALAEKGTCPAG